ncbi:unnamed protein product [Caenorhabditis brenneri]
MTSKLPVILLFLFSNISIVLPDDGHWTLVGNVSVVVTEVTSVSVTVISDSKCDLNCTFNASFVGSANLSNFPKNCSTVCASPLYIGSETNLTEKQLTNAFKNMKHLIGGLIVNGSKFKSGKFLAGLETVDCDNIGFFKWSFNDNLTEIGLPNLKTVACQVEISSNKKLTSLNLPKMVVMTNLLSEENVDIGTIPQKYCNASNASNSTDRTCGFENSTLAAMESGCVQIRGDIFIGTDEEEFVNKLESVESIFGSLTIDATNLTNIDFLGGLERVITLRDNQTAILIQYNQNLVNVSFPSLKNSNETYVEPTETTVSTDPRCLPGCIFESNLIDSATLKYFPKNCTTVCTPNALYIGYETDVTEYQLTNTFKNMKHLIGGLIFTRSIYYSSRFLASLETVDCYNYGFFKFTLNSNMTEIELPNVTNVSSPASPAVNYSTIDVEISYNAPNFCITLQEMSNLMTHDYIKFDQITGSYCDAFENSTSLPEKKTCDLENYLWSEIHSECVYVFGDVLIDSDNQEHASKLESVETIFGSLIIFGTNLTSIDFLENLEHIISLKDNQPALLVELNEDLKNMSFPKLERVLSQVYVPVVFLNNSETLMKSPGHCFDIRNAVTEKETWIVRFDGKTCVPECVYQENHLDKNSSFPTNCTTVCVPAGLTIGRDTLLTESELTVLLKNMKHLIGGLGVSSTSYTSMRFLSNLESIDCYNTETFYITFNQDMTEIAMPNLVNVSCIIGIFNNLNLGRLNLPKITPTFSSFANTKLEKMYMYVHGNARNFCISVEEMSNLMSYNNDFMLNKFEDTSGNYCELSNSSVLTQKTCDIRNTRLENLDSGCVNLYGNLTIKQSNEGSLQKLENLETIFGFLQINGTNLTSLNFLGKLRNVWSLTANHSAILVENNEVLTDITLSSLTKVFAPVYTRLSFNKNNQHLLEDPSICYGFREIFNEWDELTVNFDEKTCEELEKNVVKDRSISGWNFILFLCMLFLIRY